MSISGYGLPFEENAEAPSKRVYSLGDRVIAEVQVLHFEDVPAHGVAGFLFDNKLYREMAEVDQAVGEVAASMLLERWKQ
ncbi:MAG: hypothetical protein UZ13_01497 [Chloroflexi bacterium OLB13]|nr:MAG: hypothetical protein UZ13_01497 [Chloroflexi bacterium OLB13]